MSEIALGVISDTHGLLRPEAVAALRGSDLIIHAGDVGKPEVIDQLRGIAPTFVVRGNVDKGDWAASLPMTELVEVGGRPFFVLHAWPSPGVLHRRRISKEKRACTFRRIAYNRATGCTTVHQKENLR